MVLKISLQHMKAKNNNIVLLLYY